MPPRRFRNRLVPLFVALLGAVVALVPGSGGCASLRNARDELPPPTVVETMSSSRESQIARPITDTLANALVTANTPVASPKNALLLSGGGQYAAYNAGVLVGWTQSGIRPKFDVVTGISGGAI